MLIRPLHSLPARLLHRAAEVWPGALLCAVIAAVATVIGAFVPLLGSAIPAVVIGILIASIRKPSAQLSPGVAYAGKFILQLAVVLLGAQLSLMSIVSVGLRSLPVMLSSLCACLLGAWLLGRLLGIDRDLNILLGVGTDICGASAIAAVSPVIKARNESISYAISTVFLFNVLAVLAFPTIGRLFGMTPQAFGLFAGTAVNDTSSVVAAASVFGSAALGYAVVVKLVRTLMIIPVSVSLAVIESRRASDRAPLTLSRVAKLVPWFLGRVSRDGERAVDRGAAAGRDRRALARQRLLHRGGARRNRAFHRPARDPHGRSAPAAARRPALARRARDDTHRDVGHGGSLCGLSA